MSDTSDDMEAWSSLIPERKEKDTRPPYAFKIFKKIAETQKAWYLEIRDHGNIWLPKSQCEIKEDTVLVPVWMAEQKELVCDEEE